MGFIFGKDAHPDSSAAFLRNSQRWLAAKRVMGISVATRTVRTKVMPATPAEDLLSFLSRGIVRFDGSRESVEEQGGGEVEE